jgi:hypothetical protein
VLDSACDVASNTAAALMSRPKHDTDAATSYECLLTRYGHAAARRGPWTNRFSVCESLSPWPAPWTILQLDDRA